jgi:hypothetical protein
MERTRSIIAQAYYSSDSRFRDDYINIEDGETVQPPVKKTRRQKYVMARRNEEDDTLERIPPTESFWYTYYVKNPLLDDDRFIAKFRNRFRLPYDNFKELVNDCRDSELFGRWVSRDAAGRESTPIELLVLGGLRYLGRGWTFDDIEEATAVSKEVHRCFFHEFIESLEVQKK